jgi:serine/threonine-protein kinase
LSAGTTLSDTYEIVEQIALGGMAQVYRARNIHTDEPVAIKLVLPEFARDETIIALFKKEATVLSRLHHDAIVNYHMFTIEPRMKRPYLVMEFVDGVHLGDFYRGAPLGADSCRTLMIRIASGLAAAHDMGVIHRDLSPDNVILPEGDVSKTKIIDFGIAKAAAVGEGTLLGGKFAGKYNFVSPEQLGLGGGEITERSDMYSLGLIAAAAMLGKPLDMSGSHVQVLDKRRVIPDLSGIDPAVRPAIEAMLEPLPEDRPRDMRAVIELWAGTTIVADDGRTVIAVDPWTTTPPRPTTPPQRSGVASIPPHQSLPPQSSLPPQRSVPPPSWDMAPPADNGSTVVADQPEMHSMPPPVAAAHLSAPPRSMPPLSPPPQTSVPPQTSMPPQRSVPPQQVATGTVVGEAQSSSESPFGPYVEAGPKFQLPPEKPAKGKGAPVPLIAGVAAVVVIAGGLGLAFTQNWFGAPGSATTTGQPATSGAASGGTTTAALPVQGDDTIADAGPTPAAGETVGDGTPVTGDRPAESDSETAPAPDAETPAPPDGGASMEASSGAGAFPQPAETDTRPSDETLVATAPETSVPEPSVPETSVPVITGAAAQLAWLNAYKVDDCQYVHATQVADNAFGIEAYGDDPQAFNALATDFKSANGVDPQVGVRLLDPSQCAVADFLTATKAVQQPAGGAPKLELGPASYNLPSGGTLTGALRNWDGWTTDLLLVDYGGGIQNVSALLRADGTFALPNLVVDSPKPVPLVLLAVSGHDGAVDGAKFDGTYMAGAVLPGLLKEMKARPGDVAVSATYVRVEPPKGAGG